MKALARLIWIYLTAYPLQRWITYICLIVAAPLAFAGVIALAFTDERGLQPELAPLGFALLMLPLALVAMTALLATGVVFRAFSSAKGSQLLPHFRLKMLLSLLTICVLIAVVGAVLFAPPVMRDANFPIVLLVPAVFFCVSAIVYFVFRLMSPTPWLALELIGVISLPYLGLPYLMSISGNELRWVLAAIIVGTAGAWITLGLSYLSGGAVRPIDLAGQHARRLEAQRVPARPTPWAGTLALTTTRYPPPPSLEILRGVVVVAVLGAFLRLLSMVIGSDNPFPLDLGLWAGIGIGALYFGEMFRRSRLLWLLRGSRLEIFSAMERVAARVSLRVVALTIGLCIVIHNFVAPIPAIRIVGLAALTIGFGPLALYIGLASIRGTRWLEIALWVVAVASGLAIVLLTTIRPPEPGTIVVIVGLQLVSAIAIRSFARRRWRTIDWSAFRPRTTHAGLLGS